MSLQPDLLIDRYGAEHGRFVAIQGIPFESRAMFPSASTKPYRHDGGVPG
ncbi:glycohydrolase toxin TNT-related protein [Selenomonas ruminantium]